MIVDVSGRCTQADPLGASLSFECSIEADRDQVARALSALFSITGTDCGEVQLDAFDAVLLDLIQKIEVEVRRFVADRLSRLERAPMGTLRYLARDEIDVSYPILVHSPVLSDDDLVGIIHCGDGAKNDAICERASLSADVTAAIVDSADADTDSKTLEKLAKNRGASFSSMSMTRLIDASRRNESMQICLGARSDLEEEHILRLVSVASERVRSNLLKQDQSALAARLPHAARIAAHRISRQYWIGRFDFAAAHIRVMKYARKNGVHESTLRRFAAEDRFPDAVVAFAILARIELKTAENLLLRADLEPFLMVAKIASFSAISVLSLLKIGPWRHRLSEASRVETIERFQNMKTQYARKVLGPDFFKSRGSSRFL